MTTIEVIKMLFDKYIEEEHGSCNDCEFADKEVAEYPCLKCSRTRIDYYKPKKNGESKNG